MCGDLFREQLSEIAIAVYVVMFDAARLNRRNASSALELGRSALQMKTVSTCARALGSS